MIKRTISLCAILALALIPQVSQAGSQVWRIEDGTVTFSLNDQHLQNLGLEIVNPRVTGDVSVARAIELSLERPIYTFRVPAGTGLEFVTDDGRFSHFSDGALSVPVDGGLAFRAEHPMTRETLDPVFLYDFSVVVDPTQERLVLGIQSLDPALPVPLEVHSGALRLDPAHGLLTVRMGDLLVSPAWADRLGQPELVGRVLGVFDLRLAVTMVRGEELIDERTSGPAATGAFQDVKLGELYGLNSYGHIGSYPNGISGLSAATTSCNIGDVDVPWEAPMDPDHPTIGLAMYRELDGTLEMIGKNWMKHGFFALSSSQCTSCQHPSNGTFLGVGCSDTYSAGNNASFYYLGPRTEIDPLTNTWNPCGSYFDGTPVDCARSYFGSEPNSVQHRLEVYDEDLVAGGTFYFEGAYYIANEDDTTNEIGWRQLNGVSWGGSEWNISNQAGLAPNLGMLVTTWGDQYWAGKISTDDGSAAMAVKVTDLGGGQWHYEYAFYNRNAGRAIDELVVPVGTANITNIGFHDIDKDGGNDWTVSLAGGNVTWSTSSNPLTYQSMYNFRFDADAPPMAGTAIAGIWRPGVGTSFNVSTQVPNSDPTAVLASAGASGFELRSEPNPFTASTRLSYSVARSQAIQLQVLDVTGRTIRTLVDGPVPVGASEERWDGRDSTGGHVASGVYFFRLVTEEGTKTIKSTYLR